MEEHVQKEQGKGLAITSMVTGILSFIFFAFIMISMGLSVCSLICGIVAKNKGEKTFSKAGIILGIISLSVTLFLFLFLEVFDISSLFMIPSWYK